MKEVIITLHKGLGLLKYQTPEALQADLVQEGQEGPEGLKTMYTWPIMIDPDHEENLTRFISALDDMSEAADHLAPAELGIIAEPVGKFLKYFFSPNFLKKAGLLQ